MSLSINTNIAGIRAANQVNILNTLMSKNQERLTTGYRINRAADGPAALIIATKFGSQIAGLEAAKSNVANGINLVQSADKTLETFQTLLTQAKKLALDSMDGSRDTDARTANNSELANIIASIDRMAANTKFGGNKLLDGSFSAKTLQIGDDASQTYSLTINDMRSAALGINASTVDTAANATTALAAIESAIDDVSAERGRLGAIQANVLETQSSTLDIQLENLKAAKATVDEVDPVSEQAEYTKNQTRLQIAMAMLSQSNQMQGLVLNLFK